MSLTWEVKSISVMDRKVRPKVLRTGPPATNYIAQWNLQSSPTFTLTISPHPGVPRSMWLRDPAIIPEHSISIAVCTHQERWMFHWESTHREACSLRWDLEQALECSVEWHGQKLPRSAIPNIFDTRDLFCGRQFFQGLGLAKRGWLGC